MSNYNYIDQLNISSWDLRARDPHAAILTANEALTASRELGYEKGIAASLLALASSYIELADFTQAIQYAPEALTRYEKLNDPTGLGIALNLNGVLHFRCGKLEEALDYLMRSIEYRLIANDKTGLVSTKTNIGLVYRALNQLESALAEFDAALIECIKLKDRHAEGRLLNNIGITLSHMNRPFEALISFEDSLAIKVETNDRSNLYAGYFNIAETCSSIGELEKAEKYYQLSLEASAEFGNKMGEGVVMLGLGDLSVKKGDYFKAGEMASKALEIMTAINSKENIAATYSLLTRIAEAKGEFADALSWHRKYANEQQEIFNMQASQKLENLILQNNLSQVQKIATIERSRNEELKLAYNLIDEKNRQITDSINYSRRIQLSILPEEKQIRELLNEYFILYLPKDIVSGDFYFIEPVRTNDGARYISVAAADCTGHGVPGAFMSIFGYTYLRQSLKEKEVNSPADALNFLNRQLGSIFNRNKDSEAIRDGMDIGFCVYLPDEKKLWFAGANNSVWHIRKNKLTEIPADKQPVGYYEQSKSFTNKSQQVEKGDCVYLFTDGYADQFGGPKGKKFKYKQLKELILSVSDLPMEKQKEKLFTAFQDWKGELEQVDDVLIIGFRI
jgi:serine phosphatase RsbU (regulator of sigma subunit)